MPDLALSVLDLIPVRSGQTSGDAVAASVALAERADALGLHRYWLAEHHNMPSVASTNPPVLLGVLAGRTRRIRLGSGGVMLPNHAPFVIAEQFAALEAAAPGRVDLGIGRAPGSDPVITALLRSEGHTSDVDAFPSHIRDIEALLGRDGAGLRLATGEEYTVRATPAAAGTPQLWLLGSSDYSAELAGRLGLPYVFAHHFSGQGTEHALDLYRSRFQASEHLDAPRTFLTANVVAAETAAEAHRLALPQLQHMARLRTGTPLTALDTVEAAEAALLTEPQRELVETMASRWFIGEADDVTERLVAFAQRFEVDEVMISPAAGATGADPVDRTPARERTLELLAARLPQGALAAA
ncbi:LLM class flavin-dependent oxidoreductase [Amnibacterium kyonggiense]|uniref:Luciferase family oxidoreductase group 1 n=1 Tax=Amnibacterium kyonggiense TaxID=595671 RepID=A0A4R7FHI9_9MICO|nr:LLM class flavin-dependent oxidoreductase [Amnibacterium kyonggiense]TDS75684.1 luciferase family oxidoreductase group 1 [Amnibacterium kyonggiense]